MTVAVGFYCHDGIVVGADSMLTPSMGGINVGHHKGNKVHILTGSQLFAFAGDQGQAARFQIMADRSHALSVTVAHPIDYTLALTQSLIQQFQSTGIGQQVNVNTLLGFSHGGLHQLCVFEGIIQPRLLDAAHYYVALGSGKLSADPFLRFLVDIFCLNGPPSVREATFLTTWAIQHVIDTNPGGVAGPIRIAVMERDQNGAWNSRLLTDNEVDDRRQAVESARQSLRDWRDSLTPTHNGIEPEEYVAVPPTMGAPDA
jgi:20S proteasome alpha/beta subunit